MKRFWKNFSIVGILSSLFYFIFVYILPRDTSTFSMFEKVIMRIYYVPVTVSLIFLDLIPHKYIVRNGYLFVVLFFVLVFLFYGFIVALLIELITYTKRKLNVGKIPPPTKSGSE